MAVLMNPQSGSLQPAMLDGIAGGLETTPLTVLLAPVLVTTPKPVEFVMVRGLPRAKRPARLSARRVPLLLACEPVMAPLTELKATSPPAMLPSPVCTLPVAADERIVPALLPTKPPA